ncbi:rap guanine nucleotide exchange factor 1-like isoform X2 [Watersipora subatra]|uniref:rap guanine nucleotide exchange factor 1-like isoform X2 n=1 Tax=Watersipora subatra TaxID=2589382 RepID=UPI00355C0A82
MDNYEGVRPAYIVYGHSDRSAHSSGQLFSSHDSIDGPIGKRSSAASNSSMSSVGHGSQTKTLSDITERAHSHSIPLALSEDLSPIQPLHSNHMGCVAVDELSTRIEQLAQEFRPRSGEHTDTMTAPLKEILDQAKPRARLGSDYDNVSSTGSFDSPTTPPSNCMASSEAWVQRMGRSVMNRSFDGLTSVSQWQQQQRALKCHSCHETRMLYHKETQCQMSGQTQWTLTNKGYEQQSKSVTVRTTTESLSMTTHQRIASNSSFQPPPLPPKRKHVESYMQVFGPGQELSEFHPVESVNSKQFYLHVQEQYQLELFHPQAAIMGNGNFMYQPQPVEMGLPTNVPVGFLMDSSLHSEMQGDMDGECSSPIQHADELSAESIATSLEDEEGDYSELNPLDMIDVHDLLVRESCADTTSNSSDSAVGSSLSTINSSDSKQCKSTVSKTSSKILSGLKGGSVDALVVYATHVGKHDLFNVGSFLSLSQADIDTDFMYQEAFLTTYRTFIEPEELIDKLLYRYNKFAHLKEINKKRLSRNAFSLLVRVVDELTSKEMRQSITLKLLKLVTDLVREGELALAKIMRMKVMEKCDPNQKPVENLRIVTSGPKSPNRGLLDFKSYEVAEQLTIIENAFYQRLELPELLIWSKEQNEEKCPNLVKFTEHFNKMSYWCRNSILKPDDPTLREKHFIKFVHILKHLRKHNNFNSLLALLSALDSAPVSRLDWPKQERDMIQEYSSLIDCTSSFKSYRMALAEAQPPCIPYIGLILNDMTIIRVGNKPSLFDGGINFQMRWQLFNVLECLRRFRKPAYPFKKDPKILEFIDNFSDSNSNDDEMWERSQEIKPTSVK